MGKQWAIFLFLIFGLNSVAISDNVVKKVVILGDSLTEGFGVEKSESFPSRLQLLLEEKKLKVKIVNAGSSGSTSASALSRLKWLLKSKPQILVLALGGNDGLRGIKTKATEKNLQKTIDLAHANKLKVVLSGMRIPRNYGKDYETKFTQAFSKLAKKNKEVIFQPFLLKGVGGEKSLNLPDGIHPNPKGHKKIAENLLPFILEALK